jgi:hypothetical protein
MDALMAELNAFIIAHSHDQDLSEGEPKFLSHSLELVASPFPRFYLLFKIHKLPLKTHPIVSVSGSTLHALGRWANCQLQPLTKTLVPSFIASLWELKSSLTALPLLPSSTRLFTCNAISMYTNINTNHTLEVIAAFLKSHPLARDLPATKALISALELFM